MVVEKKLWENIEFINFIKKLQKKLNPALDNEYYQRWVKIKGNKDKFRNYVIHCLIGELK